MCVCVAIFGWLPGSNMTSYRDWQEPGAAWHLPDQPQAHRLTGAPCCHTGSLLRCLVVDEAKCWFSLKTLSFDESGWFAAELQWSSMRPEEGRDTPGELWKFGCLFQTGSGPVLFHAGRKKEKKDKNIEKCLVWNSVGWRGVPTVSKIKHSGIQCIFSRWCGFWIYPYHMKHNGADTHLHCLPRGCPSFWRFHRLWFWSVILIWFLHNSFR